MAESVPGNPTADPQKKYKAVCLASDSVVDFMDHLRVVSIHLNELALHNICYGYLKWAEYIPRAMLSILSNLSDPCSQKFCVANCRC